MKAMVWRAGGALLTGVVLMSGCGGNSGTDNATNGTDNSAGNATANTTSTDTSGNSGGAKLTGAGATFPYPIYSKWFDAYKQKTGVEINYQSVGSGAGIKQLKSNTVDFGASDMPLDDKAAAEMPSEVVQIPTVAGAVAVVYNLPGAPQTLKLDGSTLADIFMGTITRWNDPKIAALNPGVSLPATAITVAHRSDGSGTTNIFTSYLKAVSPSWATKIGAGKSVAWPVGNGGKGNDGVASTVQGTKGAIGYVELAYAKTNKMSYASLKNAAGQFVSPTVEGVTSAVTDAAAALAKDIRTPVVNGKGAKTYPISGLTYLLVYKKQRDAAKGKSLTGFITWAMTEGQKSAASLDYAPLPAPIVKLNQTTISSVS